MKTERLVGYFWLLSWATVAHAVTPIDERLPTKHENGKVEIDIGEGSVRVVGWDRDEVQITGTVGDRVERLEVKQGRRKVWIRAYVPKQGEAREVDLVIHAPHSNDIDVEVFQGPIHVTGIQGDVELETFAGHITMAGYCKRLVARTVNGDINVSGMDEKTGPDKARLATVSGTVAIRHAGREVEVQTISGPVTVAGDSIRKMTVETVSGDVRFEGNPTHLELLEIDTHAGSIVAMLPADLSAEFDITCYNGKVDNEYHPAGGNHQDITDDDSDPQAEIKATSFSGDIRLIKGIKAEERQTSGEAEGA